MTTPSRLKSIPTGPNQSIIPLEYPQSVAVYDSYADAQKAVDYLADNKFPVENLCIVGTDLKSIERVLGRRGWPQVILGGVLSGISMGFMIGIVYWLLMPSVGFLAALVFGLVMGALFGLMSSVMAHMATGGRRDFASMSATVATRYEVLGEHKVASQARDMLRQMSGSATAFQPGQTGVVAPGTTVPQNQPQNQPQSQPQSAAPYTTRQDAYLPPQNVQNVQNPAAYPIQAAQPQQYGEYGQYGQDRQGSGYGSENTDGQPDQAQSGQSPWGRPGSDER